jgi:hypothetical protein
MSTGAFTWFILLAYLVSRGHGKFSTKSLVECRTSRAALLLVSLLIGIRLIKLLSQPR